MLLGAGDMAELAARHLMSSGVKDVLIANRTYESGEKLAKEFNGRAVRFDDFIHEIVNTDIVICSTGASKYVLMKEQMQKVMKERRHKPVFIIDISVPRNIDPSINDIDNVYLYDVDDLHGIVDTNKLERQKEAEKAEGIIAEEIETFQKWLASLDSVPTVVALRDRADAVKKKRLKNFLTNCQALGRKRERLLNTWQMQSLTSSCIHPLLL